MKTGCGRLGITLPVPSVASPSSAVLSASPKDAHQDLKALWGIFMSCYGCLHDSSALECREAQEVPSSIDNCGWGVAVSQHLTNLGFLPSLWGAAALSARPVLFHT